MLTKITECCQYIIDLDKDTNNSKLVTGLTFVLFFLIEHIHKIYIYIIINQHYLITHITHDLQVVFIMCMLYLRQRLPQQ